MIHNWTLEEIMVYAASKTIQDNDVVMVGTGLPLLAAYLAKRTHAPNLIMVFESGAVDPIPKYLAIGPGDFPLISSAVRATSLFEALSYVQRGKIDVGFLGGAEIDQYGNINSTVVGAYIKPKVRLPGSGGANDMASGAKKVIIIAKHQRRKFPAKVNYLTTPGFIDGPGSRESFGLKGDGPSRLITDFGIFGFNTESKRMQILSIHPGVTLEQIRENTQFEILGMQEKVQITEIPDDKILKLIRDIDPDGVYLGK